MINILIFLRERKSSFFGDAGLTNLQRSLTELFGAGSETSATTLLFAFLYMIKHPEVQVSNTFVDIYVILMILGNCKLYPPTKSTILTGKGSSRNRRNCRQRYPHYK